jgi:hypothetical protein
MSSSSFAKFVDAVSRARESGSSWKALENLAKAEVGHRLFTVTLVDKAAALARRAYRNHLAKYPVSGTKRTPRDARFDIVYGEKRSVVANSIEDIGEVFPDDAPIVPPGCGSVINLPAVLEGALVATIKLLDAGGRYPPQRVALAPAELAIPARVCCPLAPRFDAKRAGPG